MSDLKDYIPWFLKGLEVDIGGIHIKIDDDMEEIKNDTQEKDETAEKVILIGGKET